MLTFHRAAPASDWTRLPNRNFYLNLSFLESLLTKLVKDKWKIVTIDEMLNSLVKGESDARLVNFSVDDCYRDTWEHVVPLFRRHDVPVTLFVTTGIPDGELVLGWAGLEAILADRDRIVYNGETINTSKPAHKRRWFARISAAWGHLDVEREYADFCRTNSADPTRIHKAHAITWEMLDTFRGDPLVEIGAHSVTHRRISTLSAAKALKELTGSGARLRSRLHVPCRHFAFPYGRSSDCTAREFDLARDAGFASAATTRKGLVKPGQNVFCLPRNTLNGAYQSTVYAGAALSGLSGLAAKVMGRV